MLVTWRMDPSPMTSWIKAKGAKEAKEAKGPNSIIRHFVFKSPEGALN